MSRSIWNGAISFGMVCVPVKLFVATEDKDIHFNQLHDKCKCKINLVKKCKACDVDLNSTDIIKGYEYAKNQFVVISDEDLASVPVPTKKIVSIDSFVNLDEIDSIHFEKTYYLEPGVASEKPFALLLNALRDKNKAGLAKFTLRTKERLCLIRAKGSRLLLTTLLYPDEIRISDKEIIDYPELSPQEIQMGSMIIDMMCKPFNSSEVKDMYRESLLSVIEDKISGKEIQSAPEVKIPKTDDLMDALMKSMELMKARS